MIFNIFGSKKKTQVAAKPTSLYDRLKQGLTKTRSQFSSLVASLVGSRSIDEATREMLMNSLITSDVGPETAAYILEETEKNLRNGDADLTADTALRNALASVLAPSSTPWTPPKDKPCVILFVGVNGSGKTTSIGRIGHQLQQDGKKVVLAAGDTFRAAAIEQIKAWGERTQSKVIAQQQGSDSAAVMFEAMQAAKAEQCDFLLGDTAGRLHNKTNLMQELTKVKKVIGKQQDGAPHEVWLVLDATVGQNGLRQAEAFTEAVNVTGVILTKLDGTAKGGIVFAISRALGLPVRFIGVGEQATDLLPFDTNKFIEALLESRD